MEHAVDLLRATRGRSGDEQTRAPRADERVESIGFFLRHKTCDVPGAPSSPFFSASTFPSFCMSRMSAAKPATALSASRSATNTYSKSPPYSLVICVRQFLAVSPPKRLTGHTTATFG
jgi:hypothetical protein